MIRLENISKVYRVGKEDYYALSGISFHINSGEFVSVQGASGSGKTTLLNIIGCIDNCSMGTYQLDGEDVSGLSDEKASKIRNELIGFVFQDFALIEGQSVLYNTMLPLLLGPRSYKTAKRMEIQAL